jgi:hypothetical protein
MASTTCSIKPVKRSVGRSATAAAAYRSGSKIADERTGELHDYTRKVGVVSTQVVAPENAPVWAHDRGALWNAAEFSEKRKNSQVAREFLVGLPHEMDDHQRQALALDFAQRLVDRYGFAADVCIHRPDTDGDQRNHHAHILATTRRMGPDGLTEKTRELDDRVTGPLEVRWVRQCFEDVTNAHLEAAGAADRVDMRSLKDRGLDYEPQQHMGPVATAMERRRPLSSRIGDENRHREIRNDEREHSEILVDVDEYYVERLEIDGQLVEIQIAQTAADSARYERALKSLAERIPPLIRESLALVQEHGIELPESVLEALVDRGYTDAADMPDDAAPAPPTALEREFQEYTNDQDDHDGPSM